jgi:hypothetical protein
LPFELMNTAIPSADVAPKIWPIKQLLLTFSLTKVFRSGCCTESQSFCGVLVSTVLRRKGRADSRIQLLLDQPPSWT